jgi:hypothetical protein
MPIIALASFILKRMRKNQKGFGVVDVIIILIILALIGFAAWSVSQSKKRSNQILKPLNTSEPKQQDNKPQ